MDLPSSSTIRQGKVTTGWNHTELTQISTTTARPLNRPMNNRLNIDHARRKQHDAAIHEKKVIRKVFANDVAFRGVHVFTTMYASAPYMGGSFTR
jgi:hypothetical protein